ncbi:MAG: SMP-30/gluconolactonase/LRE family protein [Deltaproteobacteria bacterium]|nr:SMP-30/gluconolactonase/LRE family protein [Deltaproteobacteria bacterium]
MTPTRPTTSARRLAFVAHLLPLAILGGCGPTETPCAGAGVICRVAGDGSASFDGDGKDAVASGLYLTSTVRRGPDGLVYVMDFNNHRLRRVEADGTLRTVIGNGIHAVAVEGAAARETPLENPIDFAFDASGGVVLIGYHDPRILRVGAVGVLEVLAGSGFQGEHGDDGPALEATFTQLSALAVAPDGRVAVCDDLSHRVRALVDGQIVAVAGVSGEAGFSGDGGKATEAKLDTPRGLAFDAEGNLYVADSQNHRIRRIGVDGLITTIAGTGEAGQSGDDGPALDATLREPNGVEIAPDGSVLVADTGNHRIRRIDASGTIRTLAGTSAGLSGDGELARRAELRGPNRATATDDAVYIGDQRNHLARVVFLR